MGFFSFIDWDDWQQIDDHALIQLIYTCTGIKIKRVLYIQCLQIYLDLKRKP